MTGFVEIGSIGWEHKQWENSYYPEELPSDWLFSYFSKQFNTAWISNAELASKSVDEIHSWLDDNDHFEFLVEIPHPEIQKISDTMMQQWASNAKLLNKVVGYVIRLSESELDIDLYLNSVLKLLEMSEFPQLFVQIDDKHQLSQFGLSNVKNVQVIVTADSVLQSKDAQIIILNFDSADNMRALGKVLNNFVNQNKAHSHLYCYFEGSPPSHSLMQSAQTIVSLLDT